MEIIIRILTILMLAAGLIALFSIMEMILYGLVSVIEAISERSIKTLFTTWNDAKVYLMVSSWRAMIVSACIAMILWLITYVIS
mgnify:CR=1 FL=1